MSKWKGVADTNSDMTSSLTRKEREKELVAMIEAALRQLKQVGALRNTCMFPDPEPGQVDMEDFVMETVAAHFNSTM